MRKLRYNVAATLDGYIASSDHTTSWIIEDATIDFDALYASFSTFIMGRKTYETMLSYGSQNPLSKFPKEAVVVVSRSGEWPNATVLREGVVDFVRALKIEEGTGGGGKRRGKDIWFMGGAALAGMLLRERLVDSLEVAVMPVVIGEGVKMVEMQGGGGAVKLTLEGVEAKSSGILMTRYEVTYDG
jgi:dihydrofolate reductase